MHPRSLELVVGRLLAALGFVDIEVTSYTACRPMRTTSGMSRVLVWRNHPARDESKEQVEDEVREQGTEPIGNDAEGSGRPGRVPGTVDQATAAAVIAGGGSLLRGPAALREAGCG
jgi:hypothetical protein